MVVNWLPVAGIALHQRVSPSLRQSNFGLAQAQVLNATEEGKDDGI
jgi:hypothetical protein